MEDDKDHPYYVYLCKMRELSARYTEDNVKEIEKEFEKMVIEILDRPPKRDERDEIACKWCTKVVSKKSIVRHMTTCKLRDDNIRKLELKMNIEYQPLDKNVCRFCNKTFQKANDLSSHFTDCDNRKMYYDELLIKEKIFDETCIL